MLTIPADYSRRVLAKDNPRVALVEDNSDNFVTATLGSVVNNLVDASGHPEVSTVRLSEDPSLDVVEMYPYVPYIQYLLPGSIVMSIFMMVMIGGGIIFIDDKARGLHEGYLVTPITKLELIAGFNLSGTIKAVIAGVVLMTIGSVIAGIPDPFAPLRLVRLFSVIVVTAFALISLMFLLMVRVSDPLVPRATFGVLNTILYFPSGAVYPQQGFPGVDARHRGGRSVHLRGSRVQEPAAQEHGLWRDRVRPRVPGGISARWPWRWRSAVQENAVTGVRGADGRTRKRLIDAATRLFAERGFKYVTVRAICREARANIAAVNYHFRDKMGLYREVLEAAAVAMREATAAAIRAGEGGTPEEKLRAYMRVHCERIFAARDVHWLQQLIHRELNDPTRGLHGAARSRVPAALRVPRARSSRIWSAAIRMTKTSSAVRPAFTDRSSRSGPIVAVEHMKGSVKRAFRPKGVAEHIATFSLAGLEAYRRARRAPESAGPRVYL